MKRDLSVIVGIIGVILVIAIFSFSLMSNRALTLANNDFIPTTGILGTTTTPTEKVIAEPTQPLVTPTPSPTPSNIPTNPLLLVPVTTTAPTIANCSNTTGKMKISATEFMNTHKEKNAYEVLMLISEPTTTEDQQTLDVLLGNDEDSAGGLYQTTSTNYTTSKFTLGIITDKGDDYEIRGTKRCQMALTEERQKVNADTTTSTDSYSRYIDFSISADGQVQLTAFRESASGGKYSGFN